MSEKVLCEKSDLTAIADAVRASNGSTESYNVPELSVAAVEAISSGGGSDNSLLFSILERTGERVVIPGITTLGESALERMPNLIYAEFPDVTYLGSYVFYDDRALEEVVLPLAEYTGLACFYNCKALTEINLPNATECQDRLAENCVGLTTVYLPKMTYVGANAFNACTSLTNLLFESAEIVYTTSFNGCTNLESVEFRKSVDFIRQNSFKNCAKLTRLILRGERVSTYSYPNIFDGTPFASGGTGGTVYVPQVLISEYEAATNWSTLVAAGTLTFAAIEGSEYE